MQALMRLDVGLVPAVIEEAAELKRRNHKVDVVFAVGVVGKVTANEAVHGAFDAAVRMG